MGPESMEPAMTNENSQNESSSKLFLSDTKYSDNVINAVKLGMEETDWR